MSAERLAARLDDVATHRGVEVRYLGREHVEENRQGQDVLVARHPGTARPAGIVAQPGGGCGG